MKKPMKKGLKGPKTPIPPPMAPDTDADGYKKGGKVKGKK